MAVDSIMRTCVNWAQPSVPPIAAPQPQRYITTLSKKADLVW